MLPAIGRMQLTHPNLEGGHQHVLAFLRRRGWIVGLTACVVAALAYLVASHQPTSYTADSVLLVPSGAGGTGPGQANEALRLASTYSELIPRDADVLSAVTDVLHVPVQLVATQLSVTPLGDTALLRIRYTSAYRARALLGSRTVANAVVAGVATSDTVPRGSVRLVSLATDSGITVSGGLTKSTLPIGVVLGLALGTILAVATERSDRRLDRADQICAVLDVPTFDLDHATQGQCAALVRLWRDGGVGSGPTMVALTGAGVPYAEVVAICRELAQNTAAGLISVRVIGDDPAASTETTAKLVLVPAGASGTNDSRQETVQAAHLVVLVVPLHARRESVRQTLVEMTTYTGVVPGFVLLTKLGRPRAERASRGTRPGLPRDSRERAQIVGGESYGR